MLIPVIPGILIDNLNKLGITYQMCKFMYNLIAERTIIFKYNGEESGPFKTYNGVPQGSVSSPLLWNLYIRDIQLHLDDAVKCLCFADDIILYVKNKNLERGIDSLQSSFTRTAKFISSLGLTISKEKTKFLIFTRQIINLDIYYIEIEFSQIKANNKVKFLGLQLDYKLK